MNQFLIAIILVLGLGGYWLYQENQTLTANNQKLEYDFWGKKIWMLLNLELWFRGLEK